MYQVDREFTDVEIIDAFEEILKTILRGYNEPIRKEFYRKSVAEQVGYDVIVFMTKNNFIHTGQKSDQEKLELEGRNEQRKDYQRAD